MNDTVSILQTQTEGLLRRVAREQESRILAIRSAAEEQAHAIVTRARQEARARLRQAVDEERRQIERTVGERRAALDTAARRTDQTAFRRLVEQAWQRLPGAVAARWQEAAARARWIEAACDSARCSLRPQPLYVVEFDDALNPHAGAQARDRLIAAGLEPVECRSVNGLGAGLRIRAGGAVVDATVPGLLASRERVEAELLAEFDHELEASAPEAAP
jgi:hypothetical protein